MLAMAFVRNSNAVLVNGFLEPLAVLICNSFTPTPSCPTWQQNRALEGVKIEGVYSGPSKRSRVYINDACVYDHYFCFYEWNGSFMTVHISMCIPSGGTCYEKGPILLTDILAYSSKTMVFTLQPI